MANSYDVSKSYILTSWLCMQWPTVESISDGYLVPCWQLSLDSQQGRVFNFPTVSILHMANSSYSQWLDNYQQCYNYIWLFYEPWPTVTILPVGLCTK